jgi:hypothetical protein
MNFLGRPFKYSGIVPPHDIMHVPLLLEAEEIAPMYVTVPGGRKIAQYAETVRGRTGSYSPSEDCEGFFTSSKFQANNNCYNYACDIATNSYAQPGRLQGFFLEEQGGIIESVVIRGAEMDGLVWVGDENITLGDLVDFVSVHRGHLVALLMSPADNTVPWLGDYHWVRCDGEGCDSWSQKDGSDQVTNFDFEGNRIRDPRAGTWKVNQGPRSNTDPTDVIVDYTFSGFMFVPEGKVRII